MEHNFKSVEDLVASEQFQNHVLRPTEQSSTIWEKWLLENPKNEEDYFEAQKIVKSLFLQASEEEIEIEFALFKDKLSKLQAPKGTKEKTSIVRPIMSIAAVFAILTFGFLFWQSNAKKEISFSDTRTTFAETKVVDLPDGTKVTLNANSKLKVVEQWTLTKNREVWLEGEAYFDVAHTGVADDRKFVVHTEKGDVEVFGTSFNVAQRKGALEVTLVTGKVSLSIPDRGKIEMKPGEIVSLSAEGKFIHRTIEIEIYTAWKEDKMIFKEAPISSIIARLQNEFGVELKVNDKKLLNRKVSASLPQNDPLLLLEALSELYDLKIEETGEKSFTIE